MFGFTVRSGVSPPHIFPRSIHTQEHSQNHHDCRWRNREDAWWRSGPLVQVRIKSTTLKTVCGRGVGVVGVRGVVMWSGRPPEAHRWFLFLQELDLLWVTSVHLWRFGHMALSSWNNGVGGACSTVSYSRLTCFLCPCSPSPNLSWQPLFCPRSAVLCFMVTIWQSSTLLQRLVPLHPTPSLMTMMGWTREKSWRIL